MIKPLAISLGLMFFQDFTGVNAVVFYTVNIFQEAGSTIDGYYATIIVGAVQLVFTVASGLFVTTDPRIRLANLILTHSRIHVGRPLW